jgi:hypothetical protein
MEVWLIMGRMIVETIISPFFLAVYLLLFTLVCWQYKRLENLSAGLIGKQAGIYLASAIRSSLLGILGGLAGSVLLIMLGINLNAIGLAYLWVIALLLILVNPRFLCFSYAAGILSLASLVFSFPLINIAHLLALVAVLHLIESLLILLNGHNYPIPLYIEKKGQVVGGFNLQKFWPLPLLGHGGQDLIVISIEVIGPGYYRSILQAQVAIQDQFRIQFPFFSQTIALRTGSIRIIK